MAANPAHSITQLEGSTNSLIPAGERARYEEAHDFIENVQDLSVTGGGKASYQYRSQSSNGFLAVLNDSDVCDYTRDCLRALKIEESEEANKFYNDAVNQASMAVISEREHFGEESLFKCEYDLPGGIRWMALFCIKSLKVTTTSGKVRYVLNVAMFHDCVKLTDDYQWNRGHLDGELREKRLMWMKLKLVKAIESKRQDFINSVESAGLDMDIEFEL
jgi:hypothetical protein